MPLPARLCWRLIERVSVVADDRGTHAEIGEPICFRSVAVRAGSGRAGSCHRADRLAGVHVVGCGRRTSATSDRQVRSGGRDPLANFRGDRGRRDIRGLSRTHCGVVCARCQSRDQGGTKQISHSSAPCRLMERRAIGFALARIKTGVRSITACRTLSAWSLAESPCGQISHRTSDVTRRGI